MYSKGNMGLTLADKKRGGKAVAQKYGSEYMRRIGKKGRKKQLEAKKILSESNYESNKGL